MSVRVLMIATRAAGIIKQSYTHINLLALSYVCTCMCLRDHACGDVLTVPILDLASLDQVAECCGKLVEKTQDAGGWMLAGCRGDTA